MRKKHKQNIVLEDLVISGLAAEGQALARHHDGMVIFIEGGVPGDVADVQLLKKKRDYAMGKIKTLKKPSEWRTQPFCQHFGTCGGCRWQFLPYEKQLEYKQQIAEEAFKRIGKLHYPPFLPIIKADPNRYYRNKLEFTFSNRRWLTDNEVASESVISTRNALGFHVSGMFDRIVDIEHCYLQETTSNAIRNEVRQFVLEQGWTFYDIKTHSGFLRNLIIRNSSLNEWMVNICFGEEDPQKRRQLLDKLLQVFPQITSLHYTINTKFNDSIHDLDIVTYHGRGYIMEQLDDVRYKISPKSFFQTNSSQAVKLYRIARDLANLRPHETLFDLYTGTGTIALFVAKQCKQVVGIEEIPQAIEDAHFNANLNNLQNAHFYAGDVKKLLSEAVEQHGRPDVLITDPPRAGMHPDVITQILAIQPKRLVYVSCNPATQARDLQLLSDLYTIEHVQPIDMFPHTFHVENVAALQLKSAQKEESKNQIIGQIG